MHSRYLVVLRPKGQAYKKQQMDHQVLTPKKALQSDAQNSLCRVVPNHVQKQVLNQKNRNRSWTYGYNPDHEMVVISRTGQIGDVVHEAVLDHQAAVACGTAHYNGEHQIGEP